MTISPLSGLSQPNGITGTLTGLSNAGGLSSQSSSGPAPTYATWSPTDKAPNFTLSGSDLIATLTGSGFDSLRANIGKQTGSGTFEIVVTSGIGSEFVGVGTASAGLAGSFVGLDAFGWGYFGGGGKFNNGVQTAFGVGVLWGNSDYMMCEVDFATMLMTIFKNTVLVGSMSISSLSGPIFPMASLLQSGTVVAINCGQYPFSRTPTPGITPYWSADA